MMLLHEHLQTGEGYTKHLCELHRINCVFLSVEHARLCLLDVLESFNFSVIATNTLVLDLALGLLVFDIGLGELLPAVIDLLIDQPVGFLQDLTDFIIGSEFDIHLHSDELFHDAGLSFEGVDLSPVRVFEVVGGEIHPWTLGHQVNHDLNESLLLERVTCVLVTLDILEAELQLGLLVELLPLEDFLQDSKSVHIWQDIPQVSVLHWLHLVYVEGNNLQDLLLNCSHVDESTVIHQVEAIVVGDYIDIVCFVQPDLVYSTHQLLSLSFLGVGVLCLLKFR